MSRNKQKEKITAKLYEIKRNPPKINKYDKHLGEETQYYYTSFIWEGRQKQITSKSLSDFIEKIDEFLKNIDNDIQDLSKALPIKDAFNIYLQEVRLPKLQDYTEERKKGNYRRDFHVVNLIYRFFDGIGIKYFHEITEESVQKFKYESVQKRGNESSTFNRRLAVLTSLNKYIENHTAYKKSDCNFRKFKGKEPKGLTNYLTDAQISTLLSVAPVHMRRLITFFLYTGLRRQNGFDLKWSEIDFEKRIITLQVKQNKTHSVPIIKVLLQMLEEIRREQIAEYGALKEYVFLYHGKRILNGTTSIKGSLKRAGIELPKGQLFHVFRHTCAIKLINDGVEIYTVQKILGHSSIIMTQRYARLQTDTMSKEMERVFGK